VHQRSYLLAIRLNIFNKRNLIKDEQVKNMKGSCEIISVFNKMKKSSQRSVEIFSET
jgi:hypothetical protein